VYGIVNNKIGVNIRELFLVLTIKKVSSWSEPKFDKDDEDDDDYKVPCREMQ